MRRLIPLVLGLSLTASATSWLPPQPMLIGSDYGNYAFKLLPQNVDQPTASARTAYGELVQMSPNGTLKTVWKRQLANLPAKVMLNSGGQVVTIDNHAGYGQPKNALVIYGLKGQVLANYSFDQLVPKPADCRACYLLGEPFLMAGFRIKWAYYDVPHLALRDENGKGPTTNLVTGKLKTNWNGQERR
ncbi:hypothetical protein [Deinococcus sp. QL22]|uniref:hypothetical protein n=1 Tax=Deinococcus sp. QL22 TaxID=2939437 RepID=UPI002017DD7C|nr:hypothetical protein [Deinococcus sp. QL22]UQN05734.1 hypothetical protein M1R55_12770 [Deinococcus sp. QL22]